MADNEGYLLAWGEFGAGHFTFKLATAAFQKLERTDTWRWATQDRFDNDPAEQAIGRGSKTLTLEGIIYTSFNPGAGVAGATSSAVGTHQLDLIRYYADQMVPRKMVDGRGNVIGGKWVLIGLRETQTYFLLNGAPQKQDFALEFRSAGDDPLSAQVTVKPPAFTVAPDKNDVAADGKAIQEAVDAVLPNTTAVQAAKAAADAQAAADAAAAKKTREEKLVDAALAEQAKAEAALAVAKAAATDLVVDKALSVNPRLNQQQIQSIRDMVNGEKLTIANDYGLIVIQRYKVGGFYINGQPVVGP